MDAGHHPVLWLNHGDHGVGSTDHFLKFLYYTSFLTPHDPTSKFSTYKQTEWGNWLNTVESHPTLDNPMGGYTKPKE